MTPEERAAIPGDYTVDEKSKRISFTDKGMLHINEILQVTFTAHLAKHQK